MALRTYYWDQRNVSLYKYYKYELIKPYHAMFKYGNAGDMFNIDLIKFCYNETPTNIKKDGNRLLLTGSITSKIQCGDIINGIGWKGNSLDKKADIISSLKIYGVRGPLTRSFFEKYNADLSSLKFEYDPGLLIKEVYNIDLKKSRDKNVVFIPHFGDVSFYKGKYPKNIKVVSIDNNPKKLAKEILKAKIVYSSSLHGIIFSHSLNKPCVFVKPQSDEPTFKFRDYYLSVGLEMPDPVKSIYSINFLTDKATMIDKNIGLKDFYFPSREELIQTGIIH